MKLTACNELFFSAANLWEIAIKHSLGPVDFEIDTQVLSRGLLDNGYSELAISGEQTVFIEHLPPRHKDPFDRILITQANVEDITLLTADTVIGPAQLKCFSASNQLSIVTAA